MEFGFSLVLDQIIHCRNIGYGDCAEFQILCPACKEPVFKRGSEYTKHEYLCHYPLKGQSDCELRVFTLVQALSNCPKVIVPRGQELQVFLAKFKSIVLERTSLLSCLTPDMIVGGCDEIAQRPTFRRLMYAIRQIVQRRLLDEGADMMAVLPPIVRELVPEVVRYLTSPNAFAAYLFAISYGCLQLYSLSLRPDMARTLEGDCPDVPEFPLLKELVETSDHELKVILQSAAAKATVLRTCAMGLLETAAQFAVFVSTYEDQP